MKSNLKKQLKMVCFICMMIPIVSFAKTLKPSTFTVNNLKNVKSGETVNLEPGNYTITQVIINAWTSVNKNNVTFKRLGNSGVVTMNGNRFSNAPEVKFYGWNNLKLENIRFVNLIPIFYICNNSTMNRLVVEGQKFTGPFAGKSAVGILRSKNVTVSNCIIKWTFTGWTAKGIKFWKGENNKLINTTIRGRLRGAVDASADQGDPKMKLTIDGGVYTRDINSGREDHGIYAHDLSGIIIKNVKINGFTDSSAGGSIKLKNIDDVEVKNCVFNTSGILLRVELKTWGHLDNIWIHDNTFNDPMGVAHWSPGFNPEAIRVENNKMCNSTVILKSTGGKINKYCAVAGKSGGVFNNTIGKTLEIPSGTNNSRNILCNGNGGGQNQLIANGIYFIKSTVANQQLISRAQENHNAFMINSGNYSDQKWIFKHLGSNVYTIKNSGTNRFLEVPYAKCGRGYNVATYTSAGGNHQKWKVIKNGSTFAFKPMHCQNVALDRAAGAINANIHTWGYNSNNRNQKWNIIATSRSRSLLGESLEKDRNIDMIKLYPNPGQDVIHLEGLKSNANVEVINIFGTTVITARLNVNVLDIENLPSGIYFLHTESGTKIQFIKK